MLGWAACAVGAGVLGAHVAPAIFPVETAADAARALVWLSMAVPVVVAFSRSRPRGLLRFRAIDLVYGAVFGVVLRLTQGIVADLVEGGAAWPSTFSTDGGLPATFPLDALAGSLVAPALEEAFFRGVVLVGVFVVIRRRLGASTAGAAAIAFSTALFLVAHALTAPRAMSDLVTLSLLSVVAGAFVVGTGRIWPAVTTHVVYNATGFALVTVGTLLA